MPGQSLPDWVLRPLDVVDEIYESVPARGRDAAAAIQFRKEVEKVFLEKLCASAEYGNPVPSINGLSKEQLNSITAGSLVRFRCMVQDEDPGHYHQAFVTVRNKTTRAERVVCTMFRNEVPLKENEECVNLGSTDRRTLSELYRATFATIPGETEWVRQAADAGFADVSARHSPELTTIFFATDKDMGLMLGDCLEVYGTMGSDIEGELGPRRKSRFVMNLLFLKHLQHSHPGMSSERNYLTGALTDLCHVREFLIAYLRSLVRGDALAAEFLLMHLLSSVHTRRNDIPVGSIPLNLANAPSDPEWATQLLNTLEHLVAKIIIFRMKVNNLNTTQLVPKVDEPNEDELLPEIKPGLLQATRHTHVFIDETQMDTGKLDTQGVQNIMALKELVKDQKVQYKYVIVPFVFRMDMPVLVVSQGKSLLDCRFVVPIVNDTTHVDVSLSDDMIALARKYLVAAKFAPFEIPKALREEIVTDFAERRKVDKSVSGESLHDQLDLARFMSLSYGEKLLTKERWERVLAMEKERLLRLKTPLN